MLMLIFLYHSNIEYMTNNKTIQQQCVSQSNKTKLLPEIKLCPEMQNQSTIWSFNIIVNVPTDDFSSERLKKNHHSKCNITEAYAIETEPMLSLKCIHALILTITFTLTSLHPSANCRPVRHNLKISSSKPHRENPYWWSYSHLSVHSSPSWLRSE